MFAGIFSLEFRLNWLLSMSFDVFRRLLTSFDVFWLLSTSFDFSRLLLTSFDFFSLICETRGMARITWRSSYSGKFHFSPLKWNGNRLTQTGRLVFLAIRTFFIHSHCAWLEYSSFHLSFSTAFNVQRSMDFGSSETCFTSNQDCTKWTKFSFFSHFCRTRFIFVDFVCLFSV